MKLLPLLITLIILTGCNTPPLNPEMIEPPAVQELEDLGGLEDRLPTWEVEVIRSVAEEYNLKGIRLRLLMAIRLQENGGTGIEMGIGDGDKGHVARRHTGDPRASLELQCRWAAGTIQKRFKGPLRPFARRYAEDWRVWEKNVRSMIL